MSSYLPTILLASFGAILTFAAWVLRAAVRLRADRERHEREMQKHFDFSETLPRANHG